MEYVTADALWHYEHYDCLRLCLLLSLAAAALRNCLFFGTLLSASLSSPSTTLHHVSSKLHHIWQAYGDKVLSKGWLTRVQS